MKKNILVIYVLLSVVLVQLLAQSGFGTGSGMKNNTSASSAINQSSRNFTNAEVEHYFAKFCGKSGETLKDLFLQHQPTLYDCKMLFTDNYYQEAFDNFNQVFSQGEPLKLKDRHYVRAEKFTTDDISEYGNGRMRKIQRYFRPGVTCYSITFLTNKNDEDGTRFLFFTYINNRWVLFPFN